MRTIGGRSDPGANRQLGMLLLLMLVFAIIMRFFSILTLWWYPFGLWPVALIAVNSSGASLPSESTSGDQAAGIAGRAAVSQDGGAEASVRQDP